jgi:hypothetical protein
MNTHSYPFDLRWTPQDLVDAVPLRLSELVAFDADAEAADAANAMESARRRSDWRVHSYLRATTLPAFIRVHR